MESAMDISSFGFTMAAMGHSSGPHPTTRNWKQSLTPNRPPSILGQRPQQAHMAPA